MSASNTVGTNSDPNIQPNQVPLAQEWNFWFSQKVDATSGWLTNPSVLGDLTLGNTPSQPLHAASKAYVDALIGGSGGGIPDAPADGLYYCRVNHNWAPAPTTLPGGSVVGDLAVSGALVLGAPTGNQLSLTPGTSPTDTAWVRTLAGGLAIASAVAAGIDIFTGDQPPGSPSSTDTGSMSIFTGQTFSSANTGSVDIGTGTAYGSGSSGYVSIQTGGFAAGGSGALYLRTGDYAFFDLVATGAPGVIVIKPGKASAATGAAVTISGGDTAAGAVGGDVILAGGAPNGRVMIPGTAVIIDTTAAPHNVAIPLTVRAGDYPEIRIYNLAGGGWPAVKMFGNIGGAAGYLQSSRVAANGSITTRWAMSLGDGSPETGGNVGGNFALRPFSDTDVALPVALQINRSTGALIFGGSPQNILTITPGAAAANPVTLAQSGTGGIQITDGTDARSLSINHSGGTIPVIASSVTNALQFAGAANESTGIGVMTFGTGNPTFSGVHAGGTLAAAAATPINSVLFAITGSGHDGTQYITPSRAQIQIAAAELWSATANGTDIRFLTTAAATLTRTEKLRLTSTGSLLLGVTGTNNTLTVTPGAAAANPVTLAQSGTGGVQLSGGQLILPTTGTMTAPSLTFTGFLNTGIYPGAGSMYFTTGGSNAMLVGTAVTTMVPIRAQDGLVSQPAYAFSGEATSGLSRTAAGTVNMSILGVAGTTWTASVFTVASNLSVGAGTQNAVLFMPGNAGTNDVQIALSGTGNLALLVNKFVLPAGTTAQPSLVFSGQTTTGLWASGGILRGTANGVDVLQISSTGIGFNGAAALAKPNVTGAWAGNTAGKALCVALAATGLITDSTTA